MKSFFNILKVQLLHACNYRPHDEAQCNFSPYIEIFYNHWYLYSTLAYLSPVQFKDVSLGA
jgi:transposase InsO family protein